MQQMEETWVRSLGQEDPLEEEMVTHSSILAMEVPWTEEPGELLSMGSQKSRAQLTEAEPVLGVRVREVTSVVTDSLSP